jgi:hypothetical protein
MVHEDLTHQGSVKLSPWQNSPPGPASVAEVPPAWLATCSAEFRLTLRVLSVVRPIRAISFGGALVFLALLAFLPWHSPYGQTALVIMSLCGLPICIVAWFVASSASRRLRRKRNHIEQLVHSNGMHLDDRGRVLTDNPHPMLVFDPATVAMARASPHSVIEGG